MSPAGPSAVRRVDFGSFVRPAEETGAEGPRVEVLLGYVVVHADSIVLFDTGMGVPDDETERYYRPSRIQLPVALAAAGVRPGEITMVANCHLHFDHCGGNPSLVGRPIVCQRRELETARTDGYTLPELIDHAGARYVELDGEAEVLPGVQVWPTPGHTDGHQSLVVRLGDGTVVLAGQSHPSAADFAAHVSGESDAPTWMTRLLALDPARVLFAHDASVWEPPARRSRSTR